MLKNYIACLLIGILVMACAAHGNKKQASVGETIKAPPIQQEQEEDSDWRSFKGVLLRHIVANCCFSDAENTVVLGQDNDRDQRVDKCYQLKGREGKIYYRDIECPDNLAPLLKPKVDRRLHCRY